MIKTYSQRILNPYSGNVQIAESEHARAVTIDGENWEIHFLRSVYTEPIPTPTKQKGAFSRIAEFFKPARQIPPITAKQKPKRQFARVGMIKQSDFEELLSRKNAEVDERIIELAQFLLTACLPFPATDNYEYWLLDAKDGSPLALIYSCSHEEDMTNFPSYPEWTALPAAVMPIDKTDDEQRTGSAPINYRLERLVADRAGTHPKACWFQRNADEAITFPPLLVKEDWQEQQQNEICQRYLRRLSSRLLMLQCLSIEDRKRVEIAAKTQALEVAKFFPLYPDVADEKIMNTIRVEARLRKTQGEEMHSIRYRWN